MKFLYTEQAQKVIAKNFYRPTDEKVKAEMQDRFAKLDLVTIDKEFGGWAKAQEEFFKDGGEFDLIYKK